MEVMLALVISPHHTLSANLVQSNMTTVPSSRSARAPLLIDLALQGGGSE